MRAFFCLGEYIDKLQFIEDTSMNIKARFAL